MANDVKEQGYLDDIMQSTNLAEGLDLDMSLGQDEDEKPEAPEKPGKPGKPDDDDKHYGCYNLSAMKINCDLEVGVGAKNKIIYVCPGKAQYFTASSLCCSGDESIEIEYIGKRYTCKFGKIKGRLGYYKIVTSGIIFIPYRNLSEYPEDWYVVDVLTFKAESICDKDVEFDVVFTYSRCVDCECNCKKSCKC